jgi:hypothetical protein
MSGPLFKTITRGGGGGTPWDDVQTLAATPIAALKRIALRSGTFVDRIETTYALDDGNVSTQAHGGNGGSAAAFDLLPNEMVIGVRGRSGSLVDQLSFLTAVVYGGGDPPLLQTHGPFGGGGGASFTIWGDVIGFYGRSGTLLDSLGCYLRTDSAGPFGGPGGGAFQDPGPVPELSRITRITIRSGSLIDSIATTYLLPDGSSETFSHGGTGGSATDIHFNPGEQIIAVVGRSGTYLDNIAFLTEDPQGVRRTYGPFGGSGGTQFIVNRKVNGFFGRSGSLIDQLGFFVS